MLSTATLEHLHVCLVDAIASSMESLCTATSAHYRARPSERRAVISKWFEDNNHFAHTAHAGLASSLDKASLCEHDLRLALQIRKLAKVKIGFGS